MAIRTKKAPENVQHISEVEDGTCASCQSPEVFIPEVGISFGMAGYDYSFCKKCLTGMTAEEFWHRLFTMQTTSTPRNSSRK
jgi:hypothetical protein